MGYTDTLKFGQGVKASVARYPFRDSRKTILGGHLKASSMLNYTTAAGDRINGLCTPCHDPHGVSPSIGDNQNYAVPMLKGTWMTSPYKDDTAQANTGTYIYISNMTWKSDRNTLSTNINGNNNRISESDSQFAGLCLRCHKKEKLTDGINKNTPFKSLDRVHEAVQGWGANNEHSYTCSKCHQPHNSGLPRLMQTNCLDLNHRGNQASGGNNYQFRTSGWRDGNWYGFPRGTNTGVSCHTNYNNDYYSSDYYRNNKEQWNNITNW
jgi:cytochrome c553